MKELSSIYKKSFFSKRHKLQWRAKPLCDAVMTTAKLKEGDSIIDVGCATGEFVQEFQNRKLVAYGIEGSDQVLEFIPDQIKDDIEIKDLRKPFEKRVKLDVVLCLEVVEHVESEYSDILVQNLCSLGDYVIVSAAPPGQKGHHHVCCRDPEYWEMFFSDQNFIRQKGDELIFKNCLEPWRKKKGLNSYYNNVLIFKKGE